MINIGKVIYSKVGPFLDNRVFPIIAEQGTSYPFAVYRRSISIPQSSKDRFSYKLRNSVEIRIVSETYDEGIEIVE